MRSRLTRKNNAVHNAARTPCENQRVLAAVESIAGCEFGAWRSSLRLVDRFDVWKALRAARQWERAEKLRLCGQRRVVASIQVDGRDLRSEGLQPEHCKDRVCPSCASRRAVSIGRRMAERFDAMLGTDEGLQQRLVFLTLTQVRVRGETLGEARARFMRSFERLAVKGALFRRHWRGMIAGCIRTFELTWDRSKGWHWHCHAILELKVGLDRVEAGRTLVVVWCGISEGASPKGQRALPVDAKKIWQLCKYPLKPVDGRLAGKTMLEVVRCLKGLRMLQGSGTLRALAKGLDGKDPQAFDVVQGEASVDLSVVFSACCDGQLVEGGLAHVCASLTLGGCALVGVDSCGSGVARVRLFGETTTRLVAPHREPLLEQTRLTVKHRTRTELTRVVTWGEALKVAKETDAKVQEAHARREDERARRKARALERR